MAYVGKNFSYRLNISFKGERNYLHGTDILSSLLNITGPVENLSVQFHKLTSKTLIARLVDEESVARLRLTDSLCILMTYTSCSERQILSVIESEDRVSMRRPYDEDQVTERAIIIGKEISQRISWSGNFFERIVALNKQLLNTIVEQQPWLFSRIDLVKAPVAPRSVAVVLTREIGGRAYQSSIIGDNVLLGHIYFVSKPI